MGRIRLLDDRLASQVAAGEVIERPASALKELLENSLDAGAATIVVRFSCGGTQLLAVEDDGSGMDRDDALLCLERHATSKIRTANDLASVATHGFRGEAVPSMASVSRFRLLTSTGGEDGVGTEILVDGGKVREVREAPRARGTTIEVQSLFFNLPARRKFLRSEATEGAHLLLQFETVALARPDVHFELIRDGKRLHRLPAAPLLVRAADLLGRETASRLREAPVFEAGSIRLSGLLAPPDFSRSDRSRLFVYINGRAVQDPVIQRGLREALSGHTRAYPVAVIFLEMDPQDFDCNVHPAKREVRFRQPSTVRDAAFEFVRRALQAQSATSLQPRVNNPPLPPAAATVQPAPSVRPAIPSARPLPVVQPRPPELPLQRPGDNRPPSTPTPAPVAVPAGPPVPEGALPDDFHLLGPLGQRYLVLQSADGLVLVDLVHASERLIYEELCRASQQGAVESQHLLLPAVIEGQSRLVAWLQDHRTELDAVGFQIEPFGDGTVKVDAMPSVFADSDPAQVLAALAKELEPGDRRSLLRALQERLLLAISRVRARSTTFASIGPAPAFLRKLLACELPYASPSGQATMLQMSWSELARKFGQGSGFS